jgi:hypothetical protein
MRRIPLIFLIIFVAPFAVAQISGHRGAITAMLMDERQRILSVGTDGFLQIWDRTNNAPVLRFQVSTYSISSMVLRPGKPELAIVETNASGLSRISVWDYEQKRNLFTFPFSDTVSHVYYSARGSYLLVAGSAGVTLIHSESGNTLPSPEGLTGQVVFAATGASERSMITYLSSGFLRYWNLETGAMTQSVNVPRDIKSPLLLGNNRFLAGFDASGLMVLDAVSGRVILRESNIRSGILFTGNPEGMEFICLTPVANAINAQTGAASSPAVSTLYHLTIGNLNRIETLNRRNTANMPAVSAGVVVSADSVALGTVDGRVMIFSQNGTGRFMNTQAHIRIEEIAASSSTLAFRTENSRLGFIPLDYSRLNSNSSLRLEDSGPYTEISASLSGNSEFLLWQSDNTRSFPLIKRVSDTPQNGSVSESYINALTLRYPLRAVSVYRNLYLFLDTVGNTRIMNQDSGSIVYDSLFSGARDAVFINERNIVLARSAGTGNSAFLMVSINTGETVPLPLAADLGVKVYRGESGFIYGAAISRAGNNNYRTSLVYINTANPSQSYSMADLDAEDTLLSIAESAPFLASTLGGSGASVYRIPGINSSVSNSIYQGIAMERSAGFPKKIISGGSYFICLDSDGNITWHDPGTGKILALFRIYADTWVMEAGGNISRGRIQG